MLQLTKGIHSQSGKEVTKIVVLGHSFDYSDNRGHSRWTNISSEFVKEIMDTIPYAVLHQDKLWLLNNPASTFSLSWDCYSPNKAAREAGAKETYELRIHFGNKGDHMYTSVQLTLQ